MDLTGERMNINDWLKFEAIDDRIEITIGDTSYVVHDAQLDQQFDYHEYVRPMYPYYREPAGSTISLVLKARQLLRPPKPVKVKRTVAKSLGLRKPK